MIVRDAVHGNIEIGEFEERIIDTKEFQRLRGIKQLGMTHLVYPGAVHTRFEHSLGTMHLASEMCGRLGFSGEEREKVRLWGLLHDLGHTAFSHKSERVLESIFGSHEEIGKRMMGEGEIGEILSENYSAREIYSHKKGEMVNAGDVGADRMDYLQRDAYYTGVSYGTVDAQRIIHNLGVERGRLVLGVGGLGAAEMMLVGRFMMFSNVYAHKTVRIASAMLKRGIECALGEGMEPELFLRKNDEGMLAEIGKTESGGGYARALGERKLYKEAYSFAAAEDADILGAREELSGRCGCDVLIDEPPKPSEPFSIKVKGKGGTGELMDESDLVRSLFVAEERRKRVLVLCPKECRKKVSKAAETYFK